MRKLRSQDQDFDRLIRGEAPSAGHQDARLVAFVDHARRIAAIPPSPSAELEHMAAVAEATQLFVDKGEPVAWPASKATGPDLQASRLPKRRRRLVLSSLFASLSAKLAAGGVAVAMAATGGLAANGNLPDQVQDKISVVAEKVGIDIPKAVDEGEEDDATDPLDEEGEPSSDDGAANGKSSSADVHAAIDATEPGPERGKAVSAAARLKPGDAEGEITGGSESGGVSADVHAAINSTEPGPERGKAVSEAASQNGHNDESDETDDETDGEEEELGQDQTESPEGGTSSSHPGATKKNKP